MKSSAKPAPKKVVKKYGLAGYNMSSVSQAPQAGYYLGKSAAQQAGKDEISTMAELQKSYEQQMKAQEIADQKQQAAVRSGEEALGQNILKLGKLGYDLRMANNAANAANTASNLGQAGGTAGITAPDLSTSIAGATGRQAAKGLTTNATNLSGEAITSNLPGAASNAGSTASTATNAANAAKGLSAGAAAGVGVGAAALTAAGMIVKNTGSDNDALTFTDKEKHHNAVGTIMQDTGQGTGYGLAIGSLFPGAGSAIGAGIGALAGLGYGIYDAAKNKKKLQQEADDYATQNKMNEAAYQQSFVNSRMMDAYKGGNQMARYGGIHKYEIGGPGDPVKGATVTPAPAVQPLTPQIDWANPGATLSIGGVNYAKGFSSVSPYEGMNRREARDAYNEKVRQYNMDWARARGADIASADPRTLQDRIPYPQMPYSPAEQRRVDAGKAPGTFFDYYQSDRTRPGTRMINNWNNSRLEEMGQEPVNFRDENPYDGQEEATSTASRHRSGLFENNGKPNYGGDHSTRTFKVDRAGQRRQDKKCKSGEHCWSFEFGGTYNDKGGVRYVNGGIIKPIPNSKDVEFEGRTHEQGGIKLDKHTEVEDHETATNMNGRQYFFSRVLKTPEGPSYAEAHKNIASSTSLDPISKESQIKQLARQQEAVAGRDPKQIARTGGMQEYKKGGPKKYTPKYTLADIPDDSNEPIVEPQFTTARYGEPIMDYKVGMEYVIDPVSGKRVYLDPSKPETYDQIIGITPPKKLTQQEQDAKDLAERERAVLNEKDFANNGGANPYNGKIVKKDDEDTPKVLEKNKNYAGLIGGLAQIAPVAYAITHPYKRAAAVAAAPSIGAPKLGRVNKSGEIEDARRQQNTMNRFLQNTNLGPGKIIAMQNVAAKTAKEIAQISGRQDEENRALRGKEGELAAEVSSRNAANAMEASKANMNAQIMQNQYEDERNLGVYDALAERITGIDKDKRQLEMQYKIARMMDMTGAFNRYEIYDNLKEAAKDKNSPYYGKTDAELRTIAATLGYDPTKGIVVDDKEEQKRTGGMGRKYTSRLGELTGKRSTLARKSI